MTAKPIFLATHPRSCSTAFERVFMTRTDLDSRHEPFGDAFYYGPERLSSRFEQDEQTRLKSGFSESTFKTVLDALKAKSAEGKRLFIKDMAYYLCPPNGAPPTIAPTCARKKRGVGTTTEHSNASSSGLGNSDPIARTTNEFENPTVLPMETLEEFHFVFLIRHPRHSIPSFFRCTTPPLDKKTGFYDFMPNEAGYAELKRLFDYLRSVGQIGPKVTGNDARSQETNGTEKHGPQANGKAINGHNTPYISSDKVEICIIDADDLLDHPAKVVSTFCKSVGLGYHESMLKWDSEKDKKQAQDAFEKWSGFHEDAMNSNDLKPRTHHKKIKADEVEDSEWRKKFGEKGAKVIRETINANVADYEYLKQFALQV